LGSIPEGDYRLFIELDPFNEIEETHKNWDYMVEKGTGEHMEGAYYDRNPDGNPAGNNIGYVTVGFYNVLNAFPPEAPRASSATPFGSVVTAASDPESKVEINVRVIGSGDMSRAAIEKALAEGKTIPLKLEIWYEDGPEFIPGFRVIATAEPGDGGTERIIAYRAIPGLVKGRRYSADADLNRSVLEFMRDVRGGKINIDVSGSIYDLEINRPGEKHFGDGGGSSGGGCNAGAGTAWVLLLLAAAICGIRKKI